MLLLHMAISYRFFFKVYSPHDIKSKRRIDFKKEKKKKSNAGSAHSL